MLNFAEQLRQNYHLRPDGIVIHLLDSRKLALTIDWSRFMRGAVAYARALALAGIQPGEVVILILQHGESLINAFFGTILHGAIPAIMPFLTEKLSPEQYRQSLISLFKVTAPTAIITYPEFKTEVDQAILAGGEPGPVRVILLDTSIAPLAQLQDVDFENLAGISSTNLDTVALLQHSSGTTGLQKGVALSYRAIANQIESYGRAISLNEQDVVVSWLPLYHDMGLIAGFLLPILRGIPLVLMSPMDWVRAPYRLLQAVSQYQGTLTWLPNFAYNFCAQKILDRHIEGVNLSSWRAVINCSEPMSYKSHALFIERFAPYGLRPEALATCYAMAENVFAVSQGGIHTVERSNRIDANAYFQEHCARVTDADDGALLMLSAGRPISNTRVCILSDTANVSGENNGENKAGAHRMLPERQIGEIAIQSDCMLTGYYHRPDATQKAFFNGWYLTGDLGYLADGEIFVAGRKKDLIIVGGKNIYPQDLETLANEVPGVHPGRVVAFGLYNENAGTEDVILVAEIDETHSDITSDQSDAERATFLSELADEIRRQVTRRSDVALRYVRLVEHGWLLKTSSGKIARSANREKYLREFPI